MGGGGGGGGGGGRLEKDKAMVSITHITGIIIIIPNIGNVNPSYWE